jgi:YfiH family protein
MSGAVIHENRNGVEYLKFEIFSRYANDLLAVFSTRKGGVSTGIYESMNLGFEVGDAMENTLENFRLFTAAIGVDYRNLVFSSQKHNKNIRLVTKEDMGKGITKERDYSDVDGLITNTPGVPIVTFHADCTPVFFYDDENKAIGLAHAGWKGTAMEIVAEMLDRMSGAFGTDAGKVKIAIGPAICGRCYEVGEDVIEQFNRMSIDVSEYIHYDKRTRKYFPDLPLINSKILISKGVSPKNISISGLCTKENPDLFFSHRQHGSKRGIQAAIMQLKRQKDKT